MFFLIIAILEKFEVKLNLIGIVFLKTFNNLTNLIKKNEIYKKNAA